MTGALQDSEWHKVLYDDLVEATNYIQDVPRETQDNLGFVFASTTGVLIDPVNPNPDHIRIEDIAHAMSLVCRYGGHISTHYSVAQHSVIVSSYFNEPSLALAGLLHDAEEYIFGDMVSPLKKRYPDYCRDADNLRNVIYTKFGVPLDLYKEIKPIDNIVYHRERASLFCGKIDISQRIRPLAPRDAEITFLNRFRQLHTGA